jgi:hypothetical protein
MNMEIFWRASEGEVQIRASAGNGNQHDAPDAWVRMVRSSH